MNNRQLQAHENAYLAASGSYSIVLGCTLSVVQYAAAALMDPSEYEEWRDYLLHKGWDEELVPCLLPTAEQQLQQWSKVCQTS